VALMSAITRRPPGRSTPHGLVDGREPARGRVDVVDRHAADDQVEGLVGYGSDVMSAVSSEMRRRRPRRPRSPGSRRAELPDWSTSATVRRRWRGPTEAAGGRDQHGAAAAAQVEDALVAAQGQAVEDLAPDRELAAGRGVQV
jgi:hypothetical protein